MIVVVHNMPLEEQNLNHYDNILQTNVTFRLFYGI